MAYQPVHARPVTRPAWRSRPRLTAARVATWWHGPHLPARHPYLTLYALATVATMAYIVSLLAPLAR